MSARPGPVWRLVAPGRTDGSEDVDWLVLRLVLRAVALVPLGLALLIAVVHAFVDAHLRPGRHPDGTD